MKHDHNDCPECRRRARLNNESIEALRGEIDRLEQRTRDLAEEHSHFDLQSHDAFVAREGETFHVTKFGHPGLHSPTSGRVQPSPFCKKCSYAWPCPTYLWATQSEPFKLVVWPKASFQPEADNGGDV